MHGAYNVTPRRDIPQFEKNLF
jgi:hypothetical protein